MTPETIAVLAGAIGGGAVTAAINAWASRRKSGAEADVIESADYREWTQLFRKEVAEVKAAHIADVAALKAEIEALRADAAALRADAVTLRAHVVRLEADKADLQRERSELIDKLTAATVRIEALELAASENGNGHANGDGG